MLSRSATCCWLSPLARRSVTSHPESVRVRRTKRSSHRADSALSAATPFALCTPSWAEVECALRMAVRAATNAGPRPARACRGRGSSTGPMPMPTRQSSPRIRMVTTSTTVRGSFTTPWISSPAVRSNARTGRGRTSLRLVRAAGTRSGPLLSPALVRGDDKHSLPPTFDRMKARALTGQNEGWSLSRPLFAFHRRLGGISRPPLDISTRSPVGHRLSRFASSPGIRLRAAHSRCAYRARCAQ